MNISLRCATISNLIAKHRGTSPMPGWGLYLYGYEIRTVWSHIAMRARVEERIREQPRFRCLSDGTLVEMVRPFGDDR